MICGFAFPAPQDSCGNTGGDTHRRDITRDHASSTDDTPLADRNAFQNLAAGPDPDIPADLDG